MRGTSYEQHSNRGWLHKARPRVNVVWSLKHWGLKQMKPEEGRHPAEYEDLLLPISH